MDRVNKLQVSLQDATGYETGSLQISCLPGQTPPPLWDYRNSQDKTTTLHDLRVLEDEEYVYRIKVLTPGVVTTDKPELFLPDYQDGLTGRFRPGLNVGELFVAFLLDGVCIGTATFEVLSKKIRYLTDYQSMLRSIASYLAEIIAERFAPSEQEFSPLPLRDAVTLYQQFAFVRSFVTGEEFREAIRRVLATPDQHWVSLDETQPLTKGMRNPAGIVKAMMRPGPRQANPAGIFRSPTLPVFVDCQILTEDVDTPENQFIYHILENWLELAVLVRERVSSAESAAHQRGVSEAEEVIAILEQILTTNLFKKVGTLRYVPDASTVLHKKEGYREIYRVFLEAQLAAQLSWKGGEDIYGAGKKNVALLYEYWVFLTLARILSAICKLKPLNIWSLIDKNQDGLSLKLRRDKRIVLRGLVERNAKQIDIVLFYNRAFKPSEKPDQGSWSREMVPDFSVLIRENLAPTHSTWLHFDAKYKVDTVAELFGPQPEKGVATKKSSISYKREDLLKMHAYKDAVRRSTGAFVLYPGTERTLFKQFTQIVPGIGAFALRPTESGPEGAAEIERFLWDVLDVFASAV